MDRIDQRSRSGRISGAGPPLANTHAVVSATAASGGGETIRDRTSGRTAPPRPPGSTSVVVVEPAHPVRTSGSSEPAAPRVWLRSGDALVAFDEALRIVQWSEEAERLTGRIAEDVLGERCWTVLALSDSAGAPICRPDCKLAEAAFANRPPSAIDARIASPTGRRAVTVTTTVAGVRGGGRLAAHLLVSPPSSPSGPRVSAVEAGLTPRQGEVLALLAKGLSTSEIQARLFLSEPTVRNHIRAILRALGCRSRLEAVVRARERGLV